MIWVGIAGLIIGAFGLGLHVAIAADVPPGLAWVASSVGGSLAVIVLVASVVRGPSD